MAEHQPLRYVFLSAVAAALGAAVVTWLPAVPRAILDLFRKPVLVVVVKDDKTPVPDVHVVVTSARSPLKFGEAQTDARGIARVSGVSELHIAVEATLNDGPTVLKHTDVYKLDSLEEHLPLNKKDFVPTAIAGQPAPRPAGNASSHELDQFRYGEQVLVRDRRVRAVLEIDWEDGITVPSLEARTSNGLLNVEGVLRDVGIDIETRWSDKLSADEAGRDGRFSDDELNKVMSERRNPQDGAWHFYIVLAKNGDPEGIGSMMFDPYRRGAVVFTGSGDYDQRRVMHEIVHEIGHMMNIPHPFQTYGDTRSVMSYPWRWKDWSYEDASVYRFDKFAEQHIRRGPDKYVKPGGSEFLEYGAPQKWTESTE